MKSRIMSSILIATVPVLSACTILGFEAESTETSTTTVQNENLEGRVSALEKRVEALEKKH